MISNSGLEVTIKGFLELIYERIFTITGIDYKKLVNAFKYIESVNINTLSNNISRYNEIIKRIKFRYMCNNLEINIVNDMIFIIDDLIKEGRLYLDYKYIVFLEKLKTLVYYMNERSIKEMNIDYKFPKTDKTKNLIEFSEGFRGYDNNKILSDDIINSIMELALARDKKNYYKPARLNSPLYPLPTDLSNLYKYVVISKHWNIYKIENYRETICESIINHSTYVKKILKDLNLKSLDFDITTLPTSDMNDLQFMLHEKRKLDNYYNEHIKDMTKNLMDMDYKTINNEDLNINIDESLLKKKKLYTSDLITMMTKLRHLLHGCEIIDINDEIKIKLDDINIISFKQGVQFCYSYNMRLIYINSDGFTTLIDGQNDKWYFMDNSHMDYLITALETINNIKSIIIMNEFTNLNNILNLFLDLVDSRLFYKSKVQFCKTFETLCLMKSDMMESKFINWEPIIKVFQGIDFISDTNIYLLLLSYIGLDFCNDDLYFNIIKELNKLTGEELLEISSIHKFIYYSEIDEQLGIEKYLKRVHTKRHIDLNKLERSKCLFRKIFIKNYYQKHKELPMLLTKSADMELITRTLSYDIKNYDDLNLLYFNGIKFGKTFEEDFNKDPLFNAKDKSCSKEEIYFGEHDGTPELLEIINRREYNLSNKFVNLPNVINEVSIGYTRKLINPIKLDIPTRLCMKEREQKTEGRLFGCATLEYKHELSYYNEQINTIVGYFNGQFINISNSEKKHKLHSAAQKLIDQDTYSLMLDIEGHNQSIHEINMISILEDISDLFDLPVLKNIACYFSKLDVYYNYNFLNKSLYSKGQLGGIEGWMNPFWTLLTLLYTELLKYDTKLEILDILVYSDDVNIIFKHYDLSQQNINILYNDIVTHYYNCGFIVKPSQTIISKNRSTLLRTHYFKGKLCDTSMKKMLSISSNTENMFVNEFIDSQTINSSINSSLESSNRIKTQLFLKWYKLITINIKTFLHFLLLKHKSGNHLKVHYNDDLMSLNKMDEETFRRTLLLNRDEMNETLKIFKIQYNKSSISDFGTIDQYITYKLNDYLRAIKDDRFILLAFYSKLILPEEMGGYNVSTLNNSLLTGQSNNLTRKLDEIVHLIRSLKMSHDKKVHFLNIIISRIDTVKKPNNLNLCSTEFPIFKDYTSTSDIMKREILNKLKKINKNISFANYLNLDKEVDIYKKKLMDLFSKNFHFRVVSSYLENSIYSISDMIYLKLEMSKSFVKRLYLPDRLFDDLYKINTETNRILFCGEVFDDSIISNELLNNTVDIISLFHKIKVTLYPEVKFIDINEPVYNNRLVFNSDHHEPFFICNQVSEKIFKNDMFIYKHLEIPKGLKIKYKEEDKPREQIPIEYKMILKNLYITKWLLYNDGELINRDSLNYVIACNINISAFCNYKYNDLESLISIPSGGEILHRLDNIKFKNKSYIKSLHNIMIRYQTSLEYDSIISCFNDSNINFGYVKDLITLKLGLKVYNNQFVTPKVLVSFNNFNTIVEDVHIKFGVFIDNDNYNLNHKQSINPLHKITIDHIKLYDNRQNNSYMSDISLKLDSNYLMNKIKRELISYYTNLVDNSLWYDFDTSPDDLWLKLKEAMNFNYEYIRKMDFLDFKDLALKTIVDYYNDIRNVKYVNIDNVMNILSISEKQDSTDRAVDRLINNMQNNTVKLKEYRKNNLDTSKIITDIVRNFVEADDRIKKEVCRKLVIEMIIKYCLCFEYFANRGVGIVINRTMRILESILNGNILTLHETPVYAVIKIVGFEFIRKYIYSDLIYIRSKVLEMNKLVKLNYNTIDDYKINLDRLDINSKMIPDELVKMVNYNSYKIDNYCKEKSQVIIDLLMENKDYCYVNSDPDSFFSLTGSDSITALLGLGKYIKDTYNNINLCDLTAGRGDGHLAFTKLNIKHTSFNRKDLFTNTFRISGLISDINYDVTEYSTLNFINEYNIILIDISYCKGEINNLKDTITNIVMSDKVCIIRINSLPKEIIKSIINSMYGFTKINLLIPHNTSLYPYQNYLSFEKGESYYSPLFMSQNFKDIIINYYFNKHLTPIKSEMKFESINSENHKLDLSPENLSTILTKMEDYINRFEMSKQISLLIENIDIYDFIVLPPTYDECFTQSIDHSEPNRLITQLLDRDFLMPSKEKSYMINVFNNRITKVYSLTSLKLEHIDKLMKSPYYLLNKLLGIYRILFYDYYTNNKIRLFDYGLIRNYQRIISIKDDMIVDTGRNGYESLILVLYSGCISNYHDTMAILIRYYSITFFKGTYRTKFLRYIKLLKLCSNKVKCVKNDYIFTNSEKNKIMILFNRMIEKGFIDNLSNLNKRKMEYDKLRKENDEKKEDLMRLLEAFAENFNVQLDKHQLTSGNSVNVDENGMIVSPVALEGFGGFGDLRALFPNMKDEEEYNDDDYIDDYYDEDYY